MWRQHRLGSLPCFAEAPSEAEGKAEGSREREAQRPHHTYRVENLKIVFDRNVSPGFRIVEGNAGWFGESGKCCVSRQKALRLL
jgi:hypothetical protein